MLTLSSLPIFALLRIAQYDQNGVPTLVCSLVLQYKINQRPVNFSIVDDN